MHEINWTAEQICSDCGQGVFANVRGMAICSVCEHEHPMDPFNLGEGERFEWREEYGSTIAGPTLHVVAYGGVRVQVPTVSGDRSVPTYGYAFGPDPDNAGYTLVRLDSPVMGEYVHSIEDTDVTEV